MAVDVSDCDRDCDTLGVDAALPLWVMLAVAAPLPVTVCDRETDWLAVAVALLDCVSLAVAVCESV